MRLVLALALTAALAARAEARVPVRVSSEVRPDTVLVGQTITLRWRAFLPDRSQLNFPARPADDSTAHWGAWEVSTLPAGKAGLREHRLTARLQSFALIRRGRRERHRFQSGRARAVARMRDEAKE